MSRAVHFVYDVLCSERTACDTRASLTEENTTPFDEYVSCRHCLAKLGYVLPADEQLTEVRGDPLLRRAA